MIKTFFKYIFPFGKVVAIFLGSTLGKILPKENINVLLLMFMKAMILMWFGKHVLP
jgi:hypothetical protein